MRPRTLLLIALSLCVGCDAVDELLGRGGEEGTTLALQSIAIASDHPVDPATPGGAAVATNGAIVKFTAMGTFLSSKGETSESDVSSAVQWTSTAPLVAMPGADGRAAVSTTAGTTTVTASSPATPDVPAMTSNAITLTVQ